MKKYDDLRSAINDLIASEADVIADLTLEDLVRYREDPVKFIRGIGLKILRVPCGQLLILLNPYHEPTALGRLGIAKSEEGITFNPFAIRGIRYALNYIIKRHEVVSKYLYGEGLPVYAITYYIERVLYPELESKFADEVVGYKLVKYELEKVSRDLSTHGYKLYMKGGL